jgi:outer membrane protein
MKPIIIKRILFLSLLFNGITVFAQGPSMVSPQLLSKDSMPLGLTQAVELGLQSSKQLKLAGAKIDEANALLQQAKDGRLPDAAVSGSALWLAKPTIDMKTKGSNGNGNGNAQEPVNVNKAIYGMLNVSQPVFAGYRIKSGIESARYLSEAAKLDAANDTDGIIQNTIAAYYNLYKADAAITVVEKNLEESQERVKDFRNMEKNGLLARNDLLKAELEASNLQLALLEAQKDRDLANVNLDVQLGLPSGTIIKPIEKPAALVADKSLEEWESLSLTHRKDVAAVREREKASASQIKQSKSDYYPSVSVTAGYFAADIPGFLTITNAVNAGAGIHYSISSLWKAKSKVAAAEARRQQVQVMGAQLNDQVRLQLNHDYQEAILSGKKITVLEQAVEQSNENYRIVHNKFNNSLATTTDLLDANVARLRANLEYEMAKADAAISYYNLERTAGVITDHFRSTP